jgi:hypothetical protein
VLSGCGGLSTQYSSLRTIMAKKKKDDDEKQEESAGGSIAVNDAWTGMLVISLLALIVGTGFLAYDVFVRYDRYNVDPTKVPVPKLTGKPPEKPVEKKDEKEKDGDKKKDEKKDEKKEDKKDGARLRIIEHYAASQCCGGESVLQRLMDVPPAPPPRRLEADIG